MPRPRRACGAPPGGDTGAGGIDLGALGAEPEGGGAAPAGGGAAPAGGEAPAAGPKDDTLLAAPGKRDDRLTSTPASRGKMYLPVKYRGGDKRPTGARTRSYQSKFSKELSGGSMRNVWVSGTQDLFGLGNGIYEQYENSYSEEIISESKDTDNKEILEQQIISNNDSLKKLLQSLETKNAKREENNEE